MGEKNEPASVSRQRIDKWLFFARMLKSRSLAQDFVKSGHVRLNDTLIKNASQQVAAGDKLKLSFDRRSVTLTVRLPGTRRGPYEEARLLYSDLVETDETKGLTPFDQAVREPGAGRPTKKDRRALDRLRTDME